jgi:hypothetical protein
MERPIPVTPSRDSQNSSRFVIPLIEALGDMEGSAKASEVISKMMVESRKTRRSSQLLMEIYEAKTFLTKAGYLVCP